MGNIKGKENCINPFFCCDQICWIFIFNIFCCHVLSRSYFFVEGAFISTIQNRVNNSNTRNIQKKRIVTKICLQCGEIFG